MTLVFGLLCGTPKIGYEHYLPRFKNNLRGVLGLDYVGGQIQKA